MALDASRLAAETGPRTTEFSGVVVVVVAGSDVEGVVVVSDEVVVHAEAPTPTAIRPRTTDSLCTTRG
jgi:hypothetical protein